jgi:hypothetical protein
MLACGAALTALAACGSPPVPQGPRNTGASSRAFVGQAELSLRYRYEPTSVAELILFVDAAASGGDVGEVTIEAEADGFEPLVGPSRWTLSVPNGKTETRQVTLRVLQTSTPTVTLVTTRVEGNAELARDTLRFIVTEGTLRECRPDDGC